MRNFFFGPFAISAWMVGSVAMFFFASWLWQIVREVGGLRGTVMATLFTCLGILFACFALLLHDDPRISKLLVGVVASMVCAPMPFAAFVLADLYAADRNNHRSFTAHFYRWYKRITEDDRENGSRHPAEIHSR